MAFQASAVANTFLRLGHERHMPLDPMKMQKLVYFAHGWHLGLDGGPLISEPIEAWDYGPVVASLYRDLKPFGAGQIIEFISEFEPTPSGGYRFTPPFVEDAEETAFLRRILDVYGQLTALQLSEMTHRPNTPWSTVRTTNPGARGVVIPDSLMKAYFKQLAQQNAAKQAAAAHP